MDYGHILLGAKGHHDSSGNGELQIQTFLLKKVYWGFKMGGGIEHGIRGYLGFNRTTPRQAALTGGLNLGGASFEEALINPMKEPMSVTQAY